MGEGRGIPGRNQPSVLAVAEELRDRGRPGGDDRDARRHRLEEDDAEGLLPRGEAEDGRAPVFLRQALEGDVAEKDGAGSEVEVARPGLESSALGPASDDAKNRRRPEAGERVEQRLDVLARIEMSDAEDRPGFRDARPRLLQRPSPAREIDRLGDDGDSAAGHAVFRRDASRGVIARRDDAAGRAHVALLEERLDAKADPGGTALEPGFLRDRALDGRDPRDSPAGKKDPVQVEGHDGVEACLRAPRCASGAPVEEQAPRQRDRSAPGTRSEESDVVAEGLQRPAEHRDAHERSAAVPHVGGSSGQEEESGHPADIYRDVPRERIEDVRSYYARILPFYEKEAIARAHLAFWRGLARRWRPRGILEVGCGIGRITASLSRQAPTVGIDLSLEMLAVAAGRVAAASDARFVAADMRRVAFARPFDLVVAPSDPFSHLTAMRDRIRALRAVAAQLSPGGRFVLEGLYRRRRQPELPPRRIRHSEGVLHIEEAWFPVGVRDLWHGRYRYRDRRPGEPDRTLEAAFVARAWDVRALPKLFAGCGLAVEAISGDFHGGPFTARAERLIVVARRESAGRPAHPRRPRSSSPTRRARWPR